MPFSYTLFLIRVIMWLCNGCPTLGHLTRVKTVYFFYEAYRDLAHYKMGNYDLEKACSVE